MGWWGLVGWSGGVVGSEWVGDVVGVNVGRCMCGR